MAINGLRTPMNLMSSFECCHLLDRKVLSCYALNSSSLYVLDFIDILLFLPSFIHKNHVISRRAIKLQMKGISHQPRDEVYGISGQWERPSFCRELLDLTRAISHTIFSLRMMV